MKTIFQKNHLSVYNDYYYKEYLRNGTYVKRSAPKKNFDTDIKEISSLKSFWDFFHGYGAPDVIDIKLQIQDFKYLNATLPVENEEDALPEKIFRGKKGFVFLYCHILSIYGALRELCANKNVLDAERICQKENVRSAFLAMEEAGYCNINSFGDVFIPSLTNSGIILLSYIAHSTLRNARAFSASLDIIYITFINQYSYHRLWKYLEDNEYDVSDDKKLFKRERGMVARKRFGRYYVRILGNDCLTKDKWGEKEYKKIDEFYTQSHNLLFIVPSNKVKENVIKNMEKYISYRYRIIPSIFRKPLPPLRTKLLGRKKIMPRTNVSYSSVTPKEMFLDDGNIYSVNTMKDILGSKDFPRVLPKGSNMIESEGKQVRCSV